MVLNEPLSSTFSPTRAWAVGNRFPNLPVDSEVHEVLEVVCDTESVTSGI